tara:strand:+ start:98328 stop:99122 length:795 start_codon:yes stop_codon:yes gene_type:complete
VLNLNLDGKTAFITGSTAGIGYAIAKGLAEQGARVILNGRSADKVHSAVESLQAEVTSAEITGIPADLGTAEGCAQAAKAAGNVDIFIHNAGIYQMADFFEADDEVWEKHWSINVMAGVRLARALTPGMVEREWGRVIFLASESAFNIPADMIHYGVTKTADVALARGLAKRLAGTNATVNSLLPGPTISDGFEELFAAEAERTGKSMDELGREFIKAARPSSILQRAASVEEVANMAVYLSSEAASATTGASVRVDGGVVDSL